MRLLEQVFSLLAPDQCLSCGNEGCLICLYCREEALPALESRCYRCNKLTKFGAVCPPCRRKSPLKHVFIRTEYSGSAKELVHKMKFSYSGAAADLIADELMNTLPALSPDTLVVHVPTITNHVRSRGFDHANRIARGISRQARLLHVSALARHGQHRQVGSRRRQRLTSMEGVFRPRLQQLIVNAPILLVDDVLTTGATIEAAAKSLLSAGAKSVDAVVFARTR